MDAGADGIALIRGILGAKNIRDKTGEFLGLLVRSRFVFLSFRLVRNLSSRRFKEGFSTRFACGE